MIGSEGFIGERASSHKVALGCGLLFLLGLLAFAGILWGTFHRDRQAAYYPGAVLVSSHANYKSLPFIYRWDDAYLTGDDFPQVFNWYSVGFDLGSERRANSGCSLMGGSKHWLSLERSMSVMVCETPNGRMVFVSRSTSLR